MPLRSEQIQRGPGVDFALEDDDDGEPTRYELKQFDLKETREVMRGWIAVGLILLVALMVMGAFVLVLLGSSVEVVERLFAVAFTPVVALAGGVIGYYFGAHRNNV